MISAARERKGIPYMHVHNLLKMFLQGINNFKIVPLGLAGIK